MTSPDPFHNLAGARLPRNPKPGSPEDIADPADGAPVLRCVECGLPDRPGNRLMAFQLLLHGKRAGVLPAWCERDYMRRNPPDPRAGDSLTVTA